VVPSEEPDPRRWRAAIVTAMRAANAYQANREGLEPLIRLAADALALAALIGPRRACAGGDRTKEGAAR
jgi:hypothetical protein